ncbi:Bud13 [Niveomyces insectorum RCEF 264]|uniref:Bud13 n=1 Tax=Niveomyces insectorum RCEF 264 TaxID=1081102 RepID=A0A168A9A2_9HYPO|nr:Bud13 [Niveomyces insectorum RCEF 264]
MASDLTSYLASRYLVAESKPSKKRKRKHNTSNTDGLLITDDDEFGWNKRLGGGKDDEDEDAGGSAAIAGTSAEFRKSKKSNWKTLGGGAGDGGGSSGDGGPATAPRRPTANDDAAVAAAAEADAIISAAAAETAAAQAAEDEAPVVAGVDGRAAGDGEETGRAAAPVLMGDGTHAGLQSAASVMAQLEKRRREEREQYERERQERRARRRQQQQTQTQTQKDDTATGERSDEEEEVVYRDATGRRVDVTLRRQEMRQAALEAEQKERAAKEALKGDVQRERARQRREQLADAALIPLARGADDTEMNRELKEQARWNDPMAPFLREKKPAGGGGSGPKGGNTTGRPVYRGPAPSNRYGIRPGYRWDGVDRSIGFEAERFKAINRRERNRGLEYEWQMDE